MRVAKNNEKTPQKGGENMSDNKQVLEAIIKLRDEISKPKRCPKGTR